MRIGIDLRSLQTRDRFRGIGAYVRNLVAALAHLEVPHEYRLFLWPAPNPLEAMELPHSFAYSVVHLRKPMHNHTLEKVRNRLLREIKVSGDDVDVFLQPNPAYGHPKGDVPTVIVAHDLIPLIFRDQYDPLSVRMLSQPRQIVRSALNILDFDWQVRDMLTADRIIAISHATKRDLLRFFPRLGPGKIVVIHSAADPLFRPTPLSSEALARMGITKPFLIYAGAVDFRKNVLGLLHAYDDIRREGHDIQLVLVGQEFDDNIISKFPETKTHLMTSPFRPDIIRTGFIATSDLVGVYSSAVALVFPSLYEGFGLPVLEAMACGCPVVAYCNSSIPEVAGSAGILLRPSDDLAAAILRVIDDPVIRAKASFDGLKEAARFSWATTALATLRVLGDAATNP